MTSSCIADAAFLQWRISPALIDAETRRRPHSWLTGASLVYDRCLGQGPGPQLGFGGSLPSCSVGGAHSQAKLT
jgi:hypothetical protein